MNGESRTVQTIALEKKIFLQKKVLTDERIYSTIITVERETTLANKIANSVKAYGSFQTPILYTPILKFSPLRFTPLGYEP